jgi:hypothetical protein
MHSVRSLSNSRLSVGRDLRDRPRRTDKFQAPGYMLFNTIAAQEHVRQPFQADGPALFQCKWRKRVSLERLTYKRCTVILPRVKTPSPE